MSPFTPVATPLAPRMPESFSQGIVANGFVFSSGSVGIDPETGQREENFKEEVVRAIDNLEAVLKVAGSRLSAVVKTTCYLTDMELFSEFNEAYQSRVTVPLPSRTTVQTGLVGDLRFEIEAIALVVA
nr:endoribonuclease L-PSP [Rhodococcus wratislaviensis]